MLLESEYELFYMDNRDEAIEILRKKEVSALLFDLSEEAGAGVSDESKRPALEEVSGWLAELALHQLACPVICVIDPDQMDMGLTCVDKGAAELLVKPSGTKLDLMRINNAIKAFEATAAMSTVELDSVCKVYTMPAFYYYAEKALKAEGSAYDLGVVSMRNFKMINSLLGFKRGDELLFCVAQTLKANFEDGIVGRLGDLFFVLSKVSEVSVADSYDKTFSEIRVNCGLQQIQMKCGVIRNVDESIPLEKLCKQAIMVVSSIRDKEEKDYAEFGDSLQKRLGSEEEILERFERALEDGEFQVWYQPLVEARDETIVAAEALVRWVPERGNVILPGEFIPVLEKNGLMGRLDQYTFKQVCKLQKARLMTGKQIIPISVNLAVDAYYQAEILEEYLDTINELGIPKDMIPIELTVPVFMPEKILTELVNKIHEYGFTLYLDDFAAGYSAFSNLANIVPDVLELDRSLTRYIGTKRGNMLIRHMISYGKEAGMKIVAEGVETQEQIEFLKDAGCNHFQGFYFSKAKNQDMFELLLDSME